MSAHNSRLSTGGKGPQAAVHVGQGRPHLAVPCLSHLHVCARAPVFSFASAVTRALPGQNGSAAWVQCLLDEKSCMRLHPAQNDRRIPGNDGKHIQRQSNMIVISVEGSRPHGTFAQCFMYLMWQAHAPKAPLLTVSCT